MLAEVHMAADRVYYHKLRSKLSGFLRFYNRLEVQAAENIPASGGMLVCPRHENFSDPLFLGASIDNRVLHFLAWDGVEAMPLVGSRVKRLGNVHTVKASFGQVTDKNSARDALGALQGLLEQGHLVVVFPEGDINQWISRGGLKPYRTGAVRLAARAGVPILPVASCGTRWVLPNILNLHHFGGPDWNLWAPIPLPVKVRIRFGEPFHVDPAAATDRQVAWQETERLRHTTAGLLEAMGPGRKVFLHPAEAPTQ